MVSGISSLNYPIVFPFDWNPAQTDAMHYEKPREEKKREVMVLECIHKRLAGDDAYQVTLVHYRD